MISFDPRILEVATEKQRKTIETLLTHDRDPVKAASVLNVTVQTLYTSVKRAQLAYEKAYRTQYSLLPRAVKCLVIPDMQIKPGIDMTFVHCIGKYIVDKKPDLVVNLGDMADMESLSSYDKFKRSYEGRRYKNDTESTITAQKILWKPVEDYNALHPNKPYKPKRVFLVGNHEERGDRVTQVDPMLEGTIDILKDLKLKEYWDEVHEFMQVVVINGVAFSHYFGTGPMNRACSTAQQQLTKMHMSCISGHQPGRQTSTGKAADGRLITSIIAGSSYDYNLDYMGIQGNKHWRGIIMLHNMVNGEFDEVYIPTHYLKDKYAKGLPPMVFAPPEEKK